MCGSRSGQQSSFAASLDGRQITRFQARCRVADPENPAMQRDQGAGGQSLLDLVSRHPGVKQLLSGRDAVRTASEPRNDSLDRVVFGRHWRS